ncbi:hypothetical protein BESB_076540 [Besnoitia besnoiti]|uniref:DPH-type MB domain-containing protein n=1 Tax=Besnoitia besnoiti TaxID=94643 RepID=A0A2A9MCW3_BESBE|nr:hypothetical protein BESB_076540 [Besnoitia besnoiti]PFH33437.1 hypothetical protein BESB_076540 [Besnoitia besnoiti]
MRSPDYVHGSSSTSTVTTSSTRSSITLVLQVPDAAPEVNSHASEFSETSSSQILAENRHRSRGEAVPGASGRVSSAAVTVAAESQGADRSPRIGAASGASFFSSHFASQFRTLRAAQRVFQADGQSFNEEIRGVRTDSGGEGGGDVCDLGRDAITGQEKLEEDEKADGRTDGTLEDGIQPESTANSSDHHLGEAGDEVYYERVSLCEFEYDDSSRTFYYPCPCGDLFEVSRETVEERVREASHSRTASPPSATGASADESSGSNSSTAAECDEEIEVEASCPSCSLKVQAFCTSSMLREILAEFEDTI